MSALPISPKQQPGQGGTEQNIVGVKRRRIPLPPHLNQPVKQQTNGGKGQRGNQETRADAPRS